MKKRVFYVVNVDWFFISHRLPLGVEMLKRGYEVYLLTKNTGRFSELNRIGINTIDIDFDRSGTNPLKDFFVLVKLLFLYKKYSPAIVHHVTIKPSVYGSLASKILPAGSVVVNAISGLGYNFIGDRNSITQKILRRLMQSAFKKNIKFIFQNDDDRNMYAQMGFLTDNHYKIIKGAGVDTDCFKYCPPVAKEKIEVLLVARMLEDKGVREFITAAKSLEKNWKGKVLFRLLGDIDEHNPASLSRGELEISAIPDYLVWHGHIADVKPFLENSDIVCLPSYREGLPKSVVEAMAIGRPVIVTDVPGCKECVDENINGFLVPVQSADKLAGAIEILLLDSEQRLRMGKASRIKMEKEMSLNMVLSETLSFYDEK